MPVISRFYGIAVRMYHNDHGPPHYHAEYGGRECVVRIDTGEFRGRLAPRAMRLLREWTELRRAELLADRELARRRKPLEPVAPLE